ncbi:ABC transporter ATP-binding protein [Desulfitobacterium chlororespirans]|uniref:Iron complex transport system ATP-binding protein n=1 Tax=Desulfitobacterium chlororespirans DSM 11544 TaxID=1121395 RepID=A0A1M7S4J1_9FIRM|nr:ABC transporter ATP-binding protein [Desulfitobacterium chlororespirans]SHN53330.1 iron complex transport system ATP-binding protein [Desulfitobacterium chlororespirans DSM 11544]
MLKVQELSFQYSSRLVLKDVHFEVPYGHCVAVLGNNGAGKSTLIKCLNKILPPRSGQVLLDERDLCSMSRTNVAKEMAYVAQHSETSRFTVFDAVMLGRKPYIKLSPSQADYEIVESMMEKLALTHMALAYIDELSGGELQKVMLARALTQQPKVLLLDEPTSNLDLKNQHDMLGLVGQIAKEENICVLMVIHDLNLALRYCDRFLFIKGGGIYAYGDEEVMNARIISEVYGIPVAMEYCHGTKMVVPFPEQGVKSSKA